MRVAAAVMVTMGAVAGLAGPATAHVSVVPFEVPKNDTIAFDIEVINERPDSGTTRVEVSFPDDRSFAFEGTITPEGWTLAIDERPLDPPVETAAGEYDAAVSDLIWTGGPLTGADAALSFRVTLRPLFEETEPVVLPARQTYESGEVVEWDDPVPEGGALPAQPSPVLRFAAASEPAGDAGAVAVVSTDDPDALAVAALVVGALGVVLGAGALGVGLANRRRLVGPRVTRR